MEVTHVSMGTLNRIRTTLSTLVTLFEGPSVMDLCPYNCSGRGVCEEGLCICEVQYSGGDCTESNLPYHVAFGCIFFLLCVISLVQLVLCVKSEFSKMDKPSLLKACRVTTQKLLYVVIIIATFSRGLYFSLQEYIDDHWATSLQTAYYPVLITALSLIVCFWAEAFHLEKDSNSPGFLSKSFIFFIIFNVCLYVVLGLQFILLHFSDRKNYLNDVFITVYAFLMIVLVVLFLVYGVEVYFKVRGAFTTASSSFNLTQLHQSRLGLVSQAILQITAAFFLILNATSALWKDRVPIFSWNFYNVVFRTVEIGLVLWFPCVLWNWERPERLWLLNPKRLFRSDSDVDISTSASEDSGLTQRRQRSYDATTTSEEPVAGRYDCWICYDPERIDAGKLIQPCSCKGDVATVHHDCLQKWLIESIDNPENMQCKVCKEKYKVKEGKFALSKGFSTRSLVRTGVIITVMLGTPIGVYFVCATVPYSTLHVLSIGACLMIEYVCLRCLGFGCIDAYKRAKVSALKIIGHNIEVDAQQATHQMTQDNTTTVEVHSVNS
ncbi:uncharacterized protein [Ptychodera flava]|uniref:uncharacterized protein n=1 Tax=Ptychodera flava TaxID=63121 RepID=UPI00396A7D73